MPSFEITAATRRIDLDDRRGRVRLNVVNTAGDTRTARFLIVPEGGVEKSWFRIAGDDERTLEPNTSSDVDVVVEVPEGAETGERRVRVDVVEVSRPEEDVTRGPDLTFEVPEPAASQGGFPWIPVVGGVVAVVVIAGSALGWYVTSGRGPEMVAVPDVVGFARPAAEQEIEAAELEVGEVTSKPAEAPAGTVSASEPGPDTEVEVGTAVALVVSEGAATRDRSVCSDAVQGTLPVDGSGDTDWDPAHVDQLCRGARDTTAPAQCYSLAMFGGAPPVDEDILPDLPTMPNLELRDRLPIRPETIDPIDPLHPTPGGADGDGTGGSGGQDGSGGQPMTPAAARELCAGTRDAAGTIACFAQRLSQGASRDEAVEQCRASG